jgi:SNF2 family DNA or RNA helicase
VELFALLHFIGEASSLYGFCRRIEDSVLSDPEKWGNTEELKERYEELTPQKVEEIRTMLKPNLLRRTKDTVLKLPPLVSLSS